MLELSPLPETIPLLTDEQVDRLRAIEPSLSSSPEHCVTCRGTKVFRWWTDSKRTAIGDYACPCVDQWVLNRFLLHSGVGLVYQRISWADVHTEPAATEKVAAYLDKLDAYVHAGIGLILHGTVGAGKTMLSTLMLKSILAKGYDGYFTTFAGMIDTFTASWHDKDEKAWFYRRIKNASVLVLDDIGREHQQRQFLTREERQAVGSDSGIRKVTTAMAESSLDEVLRHRIASSKPTIITTNLTLDKLQEGYGGNIMSLLHERSTTYKFSGEDFRDQSRHRLNEEVEMGLTRPVVLG